MDFEEEFPINKINRAIDKALFNIHDPDYIHYDIGSRFLMRLNSGRDILSYYAGFTKGSCIKHGESKVPRHIHWGDLIREENILFTKLLDVKRTILCPTSDSLMGFFRELPHLSMIDLEYNKGCDQLQIIGFLKKEGVLKPTLAHSHLFKKDLDSWGCPLYVPERYWENPNKPLSFEGVEKLRLLEEV